MTSREMTSRDDRSKTEKLEAMAKQTASPMEAAIAREKLKSRPSEHPIFHRQQRPLSATGSGFTMTTDRATYDLDEHGNVLDRSNGPRNWDYGGRWTILGATHSHHDTDQIIDLGTIADSGDIPKGAIHDLDHNSHRIWGGETLKSLTRKQPRL